jgi:hypothetical protein
VEQMQMIVCFLFTMLWYVLLEGIARNEPGSPGRRPWEMVGTVRTVREATKGSKIVFESILSKSKKCSFCMLVVGIKRRRKGGGRG